MRQGGRFNLKRCYPSFAWMRYISEMDVYTHGVSMKASANRRCENLAITVTQRQRTQCVRPSHKAIVVHIGGLGNENGSTRSKQCRDGATLKYMFIRVESELRAQSSPQICTGTESHRDLEQILSSGAV